MINQKVCVNLELEKNGRVFVLSLPLGVPFSDCYDALYEFIVGVKEMERLSNEAIAAKALADAEGNKAIEPSA